MYTPRQISSLVVCLQHPDSAEADLRLLHQKRPDLDLSAFTVSPRRNQSYILRELLAICTRDEIEQNRISPAPSAPVPGVSTPGQKPSQKPSPKKKASQKKKSTPKSAGKTSTTATPSSQPSSTTTE